MKLHNPVKITRLKACVGCGREFLPRGGRSTRCDACYPRYRQAYTLFHSALYRSKQNGLAFDLTVEEIERRLKEPCPRTGFEFALNHRGGDYSTRHPHGPSIDKINPFGGYTIDNIQVVAWAYNCAKQQFTDEEVIALCHAVSAKANSSVTSRARRADQKTT